MDQMSPTKVYVLIEGDRSSLRDFVGMYVLIEGDRSSLRDFVGMYVLI